MLLDKSCIVWEIQLQMDWVSKAWPPFLNFQLQGSARSRDDLDMEQALKPRGQNTPDVIRSAIDKNDSGIATIDNLFGAPDKIVIPERYIPDTVRTAFSAGYGRGGHGVKAKVAACQSSISGSIPALSSRVFLPL